LPTAMCYAYYDREWYAFSPVLEELQRRGWETFCAVRYEHGQKAISHYLRPSSTDHRVSRVTPRMATAMYAHIQEFGNDGPVFDDLLNSNRPDVFFTFNDDQMDWHYTINVARAWHVPTVIVAAGWDSMCTGKGHPLASAICALGPSWEQMAQVLEVAESQRQRWHVTGCASRQAERLAHDGGPETVLSDERKPILFAEQHDYPANREGRVAVAELLCALAEEFPERMVIDRPHGFEADWQPELALRPILDESDTTLGRPVTPINLVRSLRSQSVHDAIRQAWRVVTLVSCTAIDAGILGVPVVQAGWLQDPISPESGEDTWRQYQPFSFDGSVPTAKDISEMVTMVKKGQITSRLANHHCGGNVPDPASAICDVLSDVAEELGGHIAPP